MSSRLFSKRSYKSRKISAYEEYRIGVIESQLNVLRSIKRDADAINTDGVLFDAVADLQRVIDRLDYQVGVFKGVQTNVLAQPLPQVGMQPIVQNTLAQPSTPIDFPLS